jgi:hypothetical protein
MDNTSSSTGDPLVVTEDPDRELAEQLVERAPACHHCLTDWRSGRPAWRLALGQWTAVRARNV